MLRNKDYWIEWGWLLVLDTIKDDNFYSIIFQESWFVLLCLCDSKINEQTSSAVSLNKFKSWRLINQSTSLRKGQDDITNQSLKQNPQGNRKVGRPKSTWKRELKNELKKEIKKLSVKLLPKKKGKTSNDPQDNMTILVFLIKAQFRCFWTDLNIFFSLTSKFDGDSKSNIVLSLE